MESKREAAGERISAFFPSFLHRRWRCVRIQKQEEIPCLLSHQTSPPPPLLTHAGGSCASPRDALGDKRMHTRIRTTWIAWQQREGKWKKKRQFHPAWFLVPNLARLTRDGQTSGASESCASILSLLSFRSRKTCEWFPSRFRAVPWLTSKGGKCFRTCDEDVHDRRNDPEDGEQIGEENPDESFAWTGGTWRSAGDEQCMPRAWAHVENGGNQQRELQCPSPSRPIIPHLVHWDTSKQDLRCVNRRIRNPFANNCLVSLLSNPLQSIWFPFSFVSFFLFLFGASTEWIREVQSCSRSTHHSVKWKSDVDLEPLVAGHRDQSRSVILWLFWFTWRAKKVSLVIEIVAKK